MAEGPGKQARQHKCCQYWRCGVNTAALPLPAARLAERKGAPEGRGGGGAAAGEVVEVGDVPQVGSAGRGRHHSGVLPLTLLKGNVDSQHVEQACMRGWDGRMEGRPGWAGVGAAGCLRLVVKDQLNPSPLPPAPSSSV